MKQDQKHIQLDRSKLLGFKLAQSTALDKAGKLSQDRLGAKLGAKLGGKVGLKPV